MRTPLNTRRSETSRARIVELLRAGGMTVDEIAARLDLSHNAVRVQLTSMERDGLVHHARSERRTTRPSHIFELTHDTRQGLSKAYVPFLSHLTATIARRQAPKEVAALMRDVGRSLADTLRARAVSSGPLAARAAAASVTLNDELGAVTRVEPLNGHFVIRGHGCPLAAVTADHPVACLAIETFIAEMTNCRVRECCTRQNQPQCCFEISNKPARVPPRKR
jgi:DeoR family transcriptional regulator, suf operon transcriptional repressor